MDINYNELTLEQLKEINKKSAAAIADFESLIVKGHWTPAGSHTLSGYPIDELSRRGFDYERRQKLFGKDGPSPRQA